MKLFFAVSALCLFHVTFGQDEVDISTCLEQREAAKTCVKKALEDPDMEERKAKRDQLKEQKTKCFTDNRCEEPAARMEEFRECKKNVFEELLKPELEKCTNFPLPTHERQGRQRHGPPFGRAFGRRHRRSGLCKEDKLEKLEKFCSDGGDASAVYDCLEKIKKDAKEDRKKGKKEKRRNWEDFRRKMEGKREQMRGVRKCMKDNVKEECQKELKNVKRTICDCAEDLKDNEDLEENIEKAMEQCEDPRKEKEDDDDDDDDDDDEKPSHLEQMVKMVCRAGGRRFQGRGRGLGRGRGGGLGRRGGRSRGGGRGRGSRGGSPFSWFRT